MKTIQITDDSIVIESGQHVILTGNVYRSLF